MTITYTNLNDYLNAAEDLGYYLDLTNHDAFTEAGQLVGTWIDGVGTLEV